MIDKFLYWMVLISPVFYIPGSSLARAELIFFHLAMAGLFVCALMDKPKRALSLSCLVSLLCVAGLQLLMPIAMNTTMNALVNLVLGCMGIYVITQYSAGGSRKICEAMVIAGVINIVLTIGQSVGFSPIVEQSHNQFGGIMGNAPRLADYLALTFPLAMNVSLIAGLLWLVTSVYLHQYPVFLVAFVYFLIKYPKYRVHSCVLIAIFAGIFHNHIIQSLTIRFDQLKVGLDILFQSPLLGIGIGNYPSMLHAKLGDFSNGDHALSSAVEFFFNFGIVGGLAIIVILVKEFIKNRFIGFSLEEITIICLIALCLIEYPFEIIRLWPIIIAMVGFYFITHKQGATNGS
jgi:hypothetical protein